MLEQQIARYLLEIQAVALRPNDPFTWASGKKSPIYCDNRKVLSFPKVRDAVKAGFVQAALDFEPFDVVAGVATAGVPHGALLADALAKPFVYVREKPKEHGLQNRIEGVLPTAARVLVIEDLISTGGSSLKAVAALREAGAVVVGVLAIFSYNFPDAAQAFAAAQCPLHTLSHYDALIAVALENGYIAPDDLAHLKAWRG